jgi:LuxR family transcriptional regulator, maltose regulon positive regulatory protein
MPERVARERDLPSVIPKPLRFELARPRLLARLEGAKLVALVAPSGFGKTTLLAQHARTLGARAVWLELREDDADAVKLAHDVRASIEGTRRDLKIPNFGQHDPEALARALDDAPQNLTLILDRLDRVGSDAGRWLETFIKSLAEGHRVIVAGYDADALSLARLVAEGSAIVIGPDELAFDPAETEQSLRERGYVGDASVGDASAVHDALEGWPAGVALVAAGASAQLAPTDLIADALSRLPTDVRRSLPEASVLEVWSEDTAARLGCRLPTGWISTVRRAGLPLTPLGKQTYRPLQVLLEMLEAELRRDPIRHAALHRTAGIAAEASGDTLRAIQHYRTANLDDEAVRLAERVTPQLFAQAEYRLICRTLERLPFTQLSAGAQEAFGIALTETEQVTRGEVILRQLRMSQGLSAMGLYALGKLALRTGNYGRALELAEEGLVGVNTDSVDAIRLLRLKGYALSELGQHPQALEVALTAIQMAEARDDLRQLGQTIILAQRGHFMLGQWAACERLIRRGIEVFEALGQPIRALMLYNDLADLQRLMNQVENAQAILEQALPLAEQEQNDVLRYLLETRGDLNFWRGEFQAAVRDYQLAAENSARFRDIVTVRFRLKSAEALWRSGERAESRSVLENARSEMTDDPVWLRGRLDFLEAFMAFDLGDFAAARILFKSAITRTDDPTQRPRAAAFLALIEHRSGQLELAHIQKLVEHLSTVPNDAVLRVDEPYLGDVWLVCRERGWYADRFALLETTLEAENTSSTITPARQHDTRLEITTLGRLKATLGGRNLRLPFAKAGELLVWLALHGASNHEQVIDALWDGSLEEKHHEYFRVAVRRLRTALKGEDLDFNPLPFQNGVYTLSEQLEVDTDVHLAERSLETGDPNELHDALKAYQGEFLPGVETEWVTQTRTRCLENAVTVALTLAAQLETNAPREALKVYSRAIELEPLGELGHLGLIRTHLALRGLAAANQAYTAYARMLQEEFGLEPSLELRQSLKDLGLRV